MTNAEEKIANEALEQFWDDHKPATDALGLVNPSINEARMAKLLVTAQVQASTALFKADQVKDRIAVVEAKQAAVEEFTAALSPASDEVKP